MIHYTQMRARDLPSAITDDELKHWQIIASGRSPMAGKWSTTGYGWDNPNEGGENSRLTREALEGCPEALLRTAKYVPGEYYDNSLQSGHNDAWAVVYCVGYTPDGKAVIVDTEGDTWGTLDDKDNRPHLPDCTGFKWKPALTTNPAKAELEAAIAKAQSVLETM